MTKKQRVKIILDTLQKLFPKPRISLQYSNNWELLVSVILSSQCTDKMVNKVTKKLFNKYKKLDDYIKADFFEFEHDIRQTGFFRIKAKHILQTANIIKEKYQGKIPKTMNELLILPGVGRKTAHVVLGNAFGIVEGIAVDTHVRRLSQVLQLTEHKDPENIEKDLMRCIPKEEWFNLTYRLIEYGRHYCSARPHNHINCPLTKLLE